jgi:anti-sigma factor RsiW
MDKRDWSIELTAYIDGELSPTDARALEQALENDAALRALEQRLRRAVDAVEALPELDVSTERLRAAVLGQVQTESHGTVGERFWAWLSAPRLVVGLAGLAALVVAVRLPRREAALDETSLALSQHWDDIEDFDIAALENVEDIETVASLQELEVQP